MKKNIFLLITILLLTAGCLKTVTPKPEVVPENNNLPANNEQNVITEDQPKTQTYTMAEVAQHNTKEDCWLVIEGKVYDGTKAFPKHPGGEALLQGCGIDATELFNTRPMGSGTPHSDKARGYLVNYYLGDIQQ